MTFIQIDTFPNFKAKKRGPKLRHENWRSATAADVVSAALAILSQDMDGKDTLICSLDETSELASAVHALSVSSNVYIDESSSRDGSPRAQPDRVDSEIILSTLSRLELTKNLFNTPETGSFDLFEDRIYSMLAQEMAALPHQERMRVNDKLVTQDRVQIQWKRLIGEPNAIAILYNFSPYTDTGAVVASKRLRESSKVYDVIACSFAHKKKVDPTIERIAAPYVSSRTFLPMAPSWATWDSFKGYAIRASRLAGDLIASGRSYELLYTRAMWAPSHYAGLLVKRKYPHLPWTAEFSDPLSLDVEGLPRGGTIQEDHFLLELLEPIEDRYGPVPAEHRTIFGIAEIIAYAHADTILFTNEHQRTTMLEHIYSEELRERVERYSVVSNHPTLPSEYYDTETVNYQVDSSKLNLAYFGEFYSTRGLTEVTTAIRMLPAALRECVHLHVFTNYIPSGETGSRPRGMSAVAFNDLVNRAIEGVGAYGIEKQVSLNGSLPYLKFLAITKNFDYLIVNDARSGEHHAVNPYLPSKWSDYAGSSAKSWAFIEPGSSLSMKPATVKTQLGDVEQIVMDLRSILSEKGISS